MLLFHTHKLYSLHIKYFTPIRPQIHRFKTMEKDHPFPMLDKTGEKLQSLRKEYSNTELLETNINPNPFKQFDKW